MGAGAMESMDVPRMSPVSATVSTPSGQSACLSCLPQAPVQLSQAGPAKASRKARSGKASLCSERAMVQATRLDSPFARSGYRHAASHPPPARAPRKYQIFPQVMEAHDAPSSPASILHPIETRMIHIPQLNHLA